MGRFCDNKPTNEQLAEYLSGGRTNREAGLHYGASERSVARWRAMAGIDYHSVCNPDCPREFSSEQLDFINGSLLGDGSVEKYGRFRMRLKAASRPYLEVASAVLGPFAKPLRPERSRKPIRVNGKVVHKHDRDQWCESLILLSINHPLFLSFRRLWYPGGVKCVPADLALTHGSIVHWYCQDGSHNPKKRQAAISTCGFTWGEAERLAGLFVPFGCPPALWENDGKPVLGFGYEVYDTFLELVGPHMEAMGFAHKGGKRERSQKWTRPACAMAGNSADSPPATQGEL